MTAPSTRLFGTSERLRAVRRPAPTSVRIVDAGRRCRCSCKPDSDSHDHALSVWSDGRFVVGFEDKPWPSGDSQEPDFNDVLIAISPAGTAGTVESVAALPAGIIDGPEQAELDAAVGSVSSSAVARAAGAMAGGAADADLLVISGELAA